MLSDVPVPGPDIGPPVALSIGSPSVEGVEAVESFPNICSKTDLIASRLLVIGDTKLSPKSLVSSFSTPGVTKLPKVLSASE